MNLIYISIYVWQIKHGQYCQQSMQKFENAKFLTYQYNWPSTLHCMVRLSMPSKTVFPLQRQQIFQQHQMMMMRQGAAARFQSGLGGTGMMPFAARQLYDPGAGLDSRMQYGEEDEYDGLMTQREKDWVIKIQLLQLHTDNPYVDDYYFTVGLQIAFHMLTVHLIPVLLNLNLKYTRLFSWHNFCSYFLLFKLWIYWCCQLLCANK